MVRRMGNVARGAVLSTVIVVLAAAAAVASPGTPTDASTSPEGQARVGIAAASSPTVTGPITGGNRGVANGSSSLDLAARGFTEEEYFIAGTARAYTSAVPLTSDGAWTATAASSAAFTTRILVRKPTPATFNGTVLVEWFNVTGGLDSGPDATMLRDLILRAGYAWVGVSAQAVGVNGFPPDNILGNASALKNWDPVRYASLVHPGDSYSYDMFSQAAQALRTPVGANPLGGLSTQSIQKVIAIGQSQSAGRLVTYVNAVHPLVKVFDGYLIHSRGGGGAPLSQDPLPAIPATAPVTIRTDVGVPVLVLQAETDVTNSVASRQPDSATFRLWEVAGSAHGDEYLVASSIVDGLRLSPGPTTVLVPCLGRYNTLQFRYVEHAALTHLDAWVKAGTLPPPAPRIDIVAGTANTIARDADGNATGGIRTPHLDVPVATLTGAPGPGPIFCRLFGQTIPFNAATLAARYPTRAAYVTAFNAATDRAVAAGHILAADAVELKTRASQDVLAFGTAAFHGSTGSTVLNGGPVGIVATPSGNGYWEVGADGGIFGYGDAVFRGSTGALRLNAPVVGIAADPLARGYWTVAADGGVFAFGAPFFGSAGALALNEPIVGIEPTITGRGYWLVARDGGVFAFGDAVFSGSTGAIVLNSPVVDMAADPDGRGYWLLAADGGVFAFDARYLNPGYLIPALDDVAVAISPTTTGRGYWIAWRGGRVHHIGDAPNVGDATSNGRDTVGIAATPDGRGYWMVLTPAV